MPRIEEEETMFSIRTSVIATIAVVGVALGSSTMALASKVDDPTTFGQDSAVMNQGASLSERLFHVEWTAGAGRAGMSRITGYVYNDYGQAAEDVELKITGLDTAGQPVNTMFQHMGDTVPSRGRGYFDVQVPVSESYKVDVESFEFTLGHGRN
jgi:hypothetical protein